LRPDPARPLPGAGQDPVRQAEQGQDLEGRQRQAAGAADPRLRPAATSGTRDALGELLLTPPCEANPSMAALKKSNEAKFKAICTGIRTDGAYIEAGENDNLIVQKLGANPGHARHLRLQLPRRECREASRASRSMASQPTYQTISSFQYPGARPLYIYVKNAHVRAIPAIRAFVAEMTKESAIGPKGYMLAGGLVAAPAPVRARSQLAARNLTPVKFAELK
jgi:phosphate transport system substrate-binding protein